MNATSSGRGKRRRSEKITIFFDRNLGVKLPQAVGYLPGVRVELMRDHFPSDGQRVEDTEWMDYVGSRGWAVFTQDSRIWWNADEKQALLENGLRVFCLNRQDLHNTQKALYYGRHILPILRRARRPGPCFWRILPDQTKKDMP